MIGTKRILSVLLALATAPAWAQSTPQPYLQLATPSASGAELDLYRVPVLTSSGTVVYRDVRLHFDASDAGDLSLTAGYPIFAHSSVLLSGNFGAGKYTLSGVLYDLSGPGVGPALGRRGVQPQPHQLRLPHLGRLDDRPGRRPSAASAADGGQDQLRRLCLRRARHRQLQQFRHSQRLARRSSHRRGVERERHDDIPLFRCKPRRSIVTDRFRSACRNARRADPADAAPPSGEALRPR